MSSTMSSSFEPQQTTQHHGTAPQVSLNHIPRSMMPLWRVSFRVVDGRTSNYLTPGGFSEEGILETGSGQPVYRISRSYPGSPSSSSFTAQLPSLSASNIPHSAPPTSSLSAYTPNSSGGITDLEGWTINIIPPINSDSANAAYNSNLVLPDGSQGTWEQHVQSVTASPAETYPNGPQAVNYIAAADHQIPGDVSPLGGALFHPMVNFGDNMGWPIYSTTPPYALSSYSTSPSASSHENLDMLFYMDPEQDPNGAS